MNRHVKFTLVMATIAAALLAFAAIGWRIYLVQVGGLDLRPRPLAPLILLCVPAVLAAVLIGSARHLAAHKPGISEDNPRHIQAALLVNFLIVTVAQAWMALLYVVEPPPGGEAAVRFAVVLVGVAMAVRGNFAAKLSPPNIEGVSLRDGAWTRSALQLGWMSVAIGIALVACAALLPLPALFVVCLVAGLALVLAGAVHRRSARVR